MTIWATSCENLRMQHRGGSSGPFFRIFEMKFFGFMVAIIDLLHNVNVEAIGSFP